MQCPENTSNIVNDTALDCDGNFIFDKCIVHPGSYPFLSLTANSTQEQINNAIVNVLINQMSQMNTGGITKQNLTIDGDYVLSVTDNKKYYNVTAISNTPRIVLDAALPDGFECYFLNNTPILQSGSLATVLGITTEFLSTPFFTVPGNIFSTEYEDIVKNYGVITVKKQNANLYTVTGDLYNYPS